MGNQYSLNAEQLEEMKSESSFTEEELRRLFRRFKQLDTKKTGALSVQDFMAIPDLQHNPLVKRVIATIDSDKNGEVDFKEFIGALMLFSRADQNQDEKYKFTFRLYDVNGDGYISNGDLFQVLKLMVGSNLTDIQLQQLVDRTILQGDKDKDGRLSYEEFIDMVRGTEFDLQIPPM